MSRREFLSATSVLPLLAANPIAGPATVPGLAITIDDFDLTDTPIMSGEERDASIRRTLDSYGIRAAGFVAGKYAQNAASGRVLCAWAREGHLIGNHSFSHRYFDGSDARGYMADIVRCERLLDPYATYRKLFRFPYLAEGRTAQGRDELRGLLHEHGYRNGHVTIDASDWYIDNRLRDRLAADPRIDLAPYRQFYLSHMWDRANYYDNLATELFGCSIDHTLLLHHRLTTALFLGDLLAMFRKRGWRLIPATEAFASPVFEREYPTLPAGQSLIWAAAKASGRYESRLRFPAEGDQYEALAMDERGL